MGFDMQARSEEFCTHAPECDDLAKWYGGPIKHQYERLARQWRLVDRRLHGRGRGSIMKSALWLLLGVVIGAVAGWYAHDLAKQGVRAVTGFVFHDTLADPTTPYLFAAGTWRGSELANKVNTLKFYATPQRRPVK